MQIKGSKAREENRSWAGEFEHFPVRRDDWDKNKRVIRSEGMGISSVHKDRTIKILWNAEWAGMTEGVSWKYGVPGHLRFRNHLQWFAAVFISLNLFHNLSCYNHKIQSILLRYYVIDQHYTRHNCEMEGKWVVLNSFTSKNLKISGMHL